MFTTAQDMYTFVREGINKGNAGTVSPAEFDVLINGAQMQLVNHVYRSVEHDQQHVDILRSLTPAPLLINNTGANATEQEVFDLPYVSAPAVGQGHGYLHMLSVGLRIARLVNGQPVAVTCSHPSGYSPARLLRRDARYPDDLDPFSRPSTEEPYYYLVGNTMRVRTASGAFATEARIEYLRFPRRISVINSVDPELTPEANQMICDLAIGSYLENVESRRIQSFPATHPLQA